jgi:hypothetical protein
LETDVVAKMSDAQPKDKTRKKAAAQFRVSERKVRNAQTVANAVPKLTPTEAPDQATRIQPLYAVQGQAAQEAAGSQGRKGGRGKKKTLTKTCSKGNRNTSTRI